MKLNAGAVATGCSMGSLGASWQATANIATRPRTIGIRVRMGTSSAGVGRPVGPGVSPPAKRRNPLGQPTGRLVLQTEYASRP